MVLNMSGKQTHRKECRTKKTRGRNTESQTTFILPTVHTNRKELIVICITSVRLSVVFPTVSIWSLHLPTAMPPMLPLSLLICQSLTNCPGDRQCQCPVQQCPFPFGKALAD